MVGTRPPEGHRISRVHKDNADEEEMGAYGWIADGDRRLRSAFPGNVPQR